MEPRTTWAPHFEHWLDGIARILAEKGVITAGEMEARMAFFSARPDAPASAAVAATPSAPAPRGRPESESSFRHAAAPPRFAVGAAVVTRIIHRRVTDFRATRGKRGAVAAHWDVTLDANATASAAPARLQRAV
jgi:hypothetical protein